MDLNADYIHNKHKLMFSSAEDASALLIQLLYLAKFWRREETLYKTPPAWFIIHNTNI